MWNMIVSLEVRRLRKKVHEIEVSLGYTVRSFLKTNQKSKEKNSSKCLRSKVKHSEDIISQLLFLLLLLLL